MGYYFLDTQYLEFERDSLKEKERERPSEKMGERGTFMCRDTQRDRETSQFAVVKM